MKRLFAALAGGILFAGTAAQAGDRWVLEKSELTYHVSHLLHQVAGTSRAARGKGACGEAGCQALVAAPVNTFGSEDGNRDLHMLETTRGIQHPMVVVKAAGKGAWTPGTFAAELDVDFAGKSVHYAAVPFEAVAEGTLLKVHGTVPMKLTDFSIPAPSLLAVAVKDEVPVDVTLWWKHE